MMIAERKYNKMPDVLSNLGILYSYLQRNPFAIINAHQSRRKVLNQFYQSFQGGW